MKTAVLTVLSCLLISCAGTVVPPPQTAVQQSSSVSNNSKATFRLEAQRADDIVDLQSLTDKVQVTLAYTTAANFTGAPVPGYQANICYLQKDAALAVAKAAEQASRLGYRLQLLDCYRPHRASTHFMRWVDDSSDQRTKQSYYPTLEKNALKGGYIAAHSGHSRASTLDLTLLRQNHHKQWQPVDMGSAYDLFDPISHLDSPRITEQQKANRLLLKDLMQQQGFLPYAMEWWHFTFAAEKYPHTYFDFYID